MKIEGLVQVAVDHIGVHVTGPRLDIMLHFGLFEAMKLKQGKPAQGRIVVKIEDAEPSLPAMAPLEKT